MLGVRSRPGAHHPRSLLEEGSSRRGPFDGRWVHGPGIRLQPFHKKLDEVGLVSIIVPFRHWHDGTIRVDCYAQLVWTNGNEPPVPIAPNPPMAIGQKTPIRIEHRIEQPIEQSVPTTLAPTSHFVEASNGATEEAVAGRQGETAESRGKRWLNGSARGALSAHEDAELVLVGEAVQPSCPDCGGWPCQCLF